MPTYERLGIYAVDYVPAHMPTFYPKDSLGMDGFHEFYVIEDKLPVETIVLI